jgi:hypothetical protein
MEVENTGVSSVEQEQIMTGSEHTYQATFPIYALSFSNKTTQAQNSNF